MHPSRRLPFDRRTFLAGVAATGFLAACGSENSSGGDSSSSGGGAAIADDTYTMIQRFPADVQVPGEVRLPFSLSDGTAEFVTDGPERLRAQIFDIDGNPIGDQIETVRRTVTPAPYYAFRTRIADPGIYGIIVEGGPAAGSNFQVMEPARVAVPQPGQTLTGFDTPTVSESEGVDPICTREPACPFHSMTLTEALASGRPVGYLVGTPAFCQTGSCTPALEALVDVAADFDEFVFVHAEVWTDLTASTIAPAVEAVSMLFEPALFVTSADGTIVDRLDGLWDVTELRETLTAATP